MSAAFKLSDVDKGWKNFTKRLKSMKGRVTAGVHEQDADKRQMVDGEEVTNVMIGTWAEYGTATEPERSWCRATVDANKQKYVGMIRKLAPQVLDGKMTADGALALLGEALKADMVAAIDRGIMPANAPSTIAAKGSSKPLIDTASFKQSIDYLVLPAGGAEETEASAE